MVGPHRDDIAFLQEGRDLASFGSRGQQRMQILYLKLAEMAYVEEETGVKPILLLDDIFSELDHSHREIVMSAINNHQVIITSADEHNTDNFKAKSEAKNYKFKMIEIRNRNIYLDQGDGGGDVSYWEKKLGISRTDPNFAWHVAQETSNLSKDKADEVIANITKAFKIVPAGKRLFLHKPNNNAPVVYGERED